MAFLHAVLSFFFSSRRRHTRYLSDWSSDVCSSDLPPATTPRFSPASRGIRSRPSSRRSEEHTSELQSLRHLVCRLLLEKKKQNPYQMSPREAMNGFYMLKAKKDNK